MQAQFMVQLEAYHNWNLIIPEKRVYFNLMRNDARFTIVLSNKGNTYEQIELELIPDNKASIINSGISGLQNEVILPPNTDTTLSLK